MNDDQISLRVMALAGLLQALQEVRHLAENGRVDQARLQTAMDSVLRIDADSVAEIYGGVMEHFDAAFIPKRGLFG